MLFLYRINKYLKNNIFTLLNQLFIYFKNTILLFLATPWHFFSFLFLFIFFNRWRIQNPIVPFCLIKFYNSSNTWKMSFRWWKPNYVIDESNQSNREGKSRETEETHKTILFNSIIYVYTRHDTTPETNDISSDN